MKNWTKTPVTKKQIDELCNQHIQNKIRALFGKDLSETELKYYTQILTTILLRRNVNEQKDMLYYLEDDLRFQHNPFLFNSMEDAVERILQARDEKEKVLIFGDKDVDGITSTTILYDYLKKIGIDVSWRVPVNNDAYGLSIEAIDNFAAIEGSLIITVDCGISNIEEINHANELGIDVIVTDHHNAPELLPDAIVILDPKILDSGYPFSDISGAAVAYKLVSALRFANTDFYNAEICLFNISLDSENKCYNVDCLSIRNLTKVKELHEKIIPGKTSIYDLKLPYFLQGQLIYVWDAPQIKSILRDIFGSGIEFNLNDLKKDIVKMMPSLNTKKAEDLKELSLIAKYIEEENTAINSLFNLYVTYCKRIIAAKHSEDVTDEQKDLQLVAIAAIADIMPLQNENRIFVRKGIESIKKYKPRPGLLELFSKMRIDTESITAKDLSWSLTPALNAAGRLGEADVAAKLLISDNAQEREQLAQQVYDFNEKRKQMVSDTYYFIHNKSEESLHENQEKLCLIIDKQINKGLTGNFAGKLMQEFGIPSIAISECEDIYVGSMRTCRGVIATDFLNQFGDFFINHGGHNFAAGFSFEKSKLEAFKQKIKEIVSKLELEEENSNISIDAEIPPQLLSPSTFRLLDIMEPFGSQNTELIVKSSGVRIAEATIVGKKEPFSLKLLIDCGKYKFPAIFWNEAQRLNRDIFIGESYDILYNMSRNHFNRMTSSQFELIDIKPSTNETRG